MIAREDSGQRGAEQWRKLAGIGRSYVIVVEVDTGMAYDHRT